MFHIVDKYRTAAQITLGIIGISFMAFGMSSFQIAPDNNYIVKIGEQRITNHQLDEALRNTQQAGGAIDRQAVFNTLVQTAYLLEGAKQMGVVVSDEQIKQMIVDRPEFHNALGKFDPALFKNYLDAIHKSEKVFMQEERNRLTIALLLRTLNSGVASDTQAKQLLNATLAIRTIRTASIDITQFANKIHLNDEVLRQFYEANKASYAILQGVQFEYIQLSPKDLVNKQDVSDAEIDKALAETKNNFQPKRQIAHILINAPKTADNAMRAKAREQAEQIAKEAQAKPDDFARLAQKYSQDTGSADKGGDLGTFSANDSIGGSTALTDGAFALKEGEVSGVIESDFGYHILRATHIEQVNVATQREHIKRALQEKKAQKAYGQLRDELSEITLVNSTELKSAADKAGVTLHTQSEWLTHANAESLGVPSAVVEALFSDDVFNKKHNSEAINSDGVTWFVRATAIRPAGTETFEQVQARVKQDYIKSETLRLAKEEGQNLVKKLNAGENVNVSWSSVQEVAPAEIRSHLPENAFIALMNAIPKEGKPAFAFLDIPDMPQLVEVQRIQASDDPELIRSAKLVLAQNNGNALVEAYIDSLRSQVKTQQGIEKLNDGE